jgi:hypothetical protein
VAVETGSFQGFFGPAAKFFTRCTNDNAIVFTAIICLFILYFVLKITLGTIFTSICKMIFSTESEDIEKAKRGGSVDYCMRLQKDVIEDEKKLNARNKQKKGNTEEISEKLYQKRAGLCAAVEQLAKKSPDGILKIKGMKIKKFTTLPSYNYQMHPDMRDLFIDD